MAFRRANFRNSASLEQMSGPQGSKARQTTLKSFSDTLRATQLLTPSGSAERNSAGGGQEQGGSVQAVLDRQVPSPACPLLRKRRHLDDFERRDLVGRIVSTRTLRSVSD
eukprot:1205532-Amphidinium_carterae.1